MAGQIFNGNINAQATAWMMVYMLLFAVAWEAGTGWLEKRTEDNKAHSEMLGKVARELMILGFIAFMIILMKELSILHWNPETLHVFEFCDLLVSICVLIYVANCAISSFTMAATQRQWDRMSMVQTSVIMDKVSSYIKGLDNSVWKRFKHRMPFIPSRWRYEADFKVMQLLFERKFHLPLHFDYVEYMKLVLQNVVVSMANISTWHWVMIILINVLWYIVIFPWSTDDSHICLFATECDSNGPWRRLGGAATDDGDSSGTGEDDIDSQETRRWMLVFVAIGWFTVMLLALIVMNIDTRMRRILAYNGALKDENIVELLGSMQKSLHKERSFAEDDRETEGNIDENERMTMKDDNESNTTTLVEVAKLHHRHLVTLDTGVHAHDSDADHIMLFKDAGAIGISKDSNDILSIRKKEVMVFLVQFLQLVIDFYLGFYLVHMRMRVTIASDGNAVAQVLFHLAILLPVLLMLYLLMLTARKLALLFGVLHLNENAVSEVLQHMELVKNMRRRIQDTLASTKIVHSTANPEGAAALLEKAQHGEVSILKRLAMRTQSDRIDKAEMLGMMKAHFEFVTLSADELNAFLDRAAFRAYELLDAEHQATAQTARTLLYTEDGDIAGDSILIREFGALLMRYVADITEEALAMSPVSGLVPQFSQGVAQLASVDAAMIEHAGRLTRSKALFRATDKDKSGTVSRSEMFTALRQVKVPITRKEFREVFRVIDPDQTHSMNMEEWVDFMTATDVGLDLHTTNAAATEQRKNSQPGKGWNILRSRKRNLIVAP